MSCKVVTGEATRVAAPIPWRRVAVPVEEAASVPDASPVEDPESLPPLVEDLTPQLRELEEQNRRLRLRVNQLELEGEQRTRQARQDGFREGEAEGARKMGEKVEPVFQKLVESISAIESLRPRLRHEAEEDVVKLSLAIARRVLHRELSVDPGALLGIVSAALKRLDLREVSRIRVHPSDVATLRSSLEQAGLPARGELVADATLARGEVIIETVRGELDASLETQLMEIERGLADLMSRKA